MKRMIRSSVSNTIAKINKAKRELDNYSPEQVEYVQECQDEISKAISKYYELEDESVGPRLSEIKRDYLVGAIEDDLMTEEEFDDIFALLDVIGLELSAPYA